MKIVKKIQGMQKVTFLQCFLTVLAVALYLASNVITGRQITLPFGLISAGGLLLFPLTYILSDVFSEVYGYKWSRLTCIFSFIVQAIASIVFILTVALPYPETFTSNDAFITVLGTTPRVCLASLLAFYLGDLANDVVFKLMKKRHIKETKGFGWRAIMSSVAGGIVDGLVFAPVAFAGVLPIEVIVTMMFSSLPIKIAYEIILLPITVLVVKKVKKVERTN